MGNPQHLEWLLEGVQAWNARREKTPFVPDLSGMNIAGAIVNSQGTNPWEISSLQGINLSNALLAEADLRHLDFAKSSFEGSDLSQCYLFCTYLDGCNLTKAVFAQANLSYARLSQSDLRYANLLGSDLANADLSNAKINGANFDFAYMRSADLKGADARSVLDRKGSRKLIITDFSKAKWLQKPAVEGMLGDQATVLPARLSRPKHWPDVDITLNTEQDTSGEGSGAEALADLNAPLVRASSMDFAFTAAGIEAKLSEEQAIHPPQLAGDCADRRDALIANGRDIAKTINNQLAAEARGDLESYAEHLQTADPANPHRLNFIATGLQADLEDDFKSGGFDRRLRKRLEAFLAQHEEFLRDCAPAAAEAIRIKAEAQFTQPVSKQQVTEMLDKLTAAIEATESATASVTNMLDQLKDHDAHLNLQKLRLSTAPELARYDATVQAEAKEIITITSRLYHRAKEAYEKIGPKNVQDMAAYSVLGDVSIKGAKIIIDQLGPVMAWFAKLLAALPPL